MSKSKKNNNDTESQHVAKADVRHKFKVAELTDFNRRETRPDGSEKMMPRIAVLTPVEGGKQVRAHIPGNLDGPLEVGSVVMCRPHDKQHNGDGPPVKFRITNVVGAGGESGTMTPAQNAEFGERAERERPARTASAEPSSPERREAGVRR